MKYLPSANSNYSERVSNLFHLAVAALMGVATLSVALHVAAFLA